MIPQKPLAGESFAAMFTHQRLCSDEISKCTDVSTRANTFSKFSTIGIRENKASSSPTGSACLWRWSNNFVLLENMLPHRDPPTGTRLGAHAPRLVVLAHDGRHGAIFARCSTGRGRCLPGLMLVGMGLGFYGSGPLLSRLRVTGEMMLQVGPIRIFGENQRHPDVRFVQLGPKAVDAASTREVRPCHDDRNYEAGERKMRRTARAGEGGLHV
ncbi:hypothetical protein EYF80_029922 [Liparis tanakae]|uniref:Uncharacterized protein n=1 Tax=Liparis tanakae TaxID=230148 RepID=A0A4Z2H456_9TELE|nr:hypothetical protein EYF80_029922 [Liparis tanakae]